MRKIQFVLLVVLAALVCGQCSDSSDPTEPTPQQIRTPAQLTQTEKDLVGSTNEFAFDLFHRINAGAQAGKNVFISPVSVSVALGFAANGADGDTRSEMADVLRIGNFSMTEADQAYHDLAEILMNADPAVKFRIANSFWSRKGVGIQPGFLEIARKYFDARVSELDFGAPGIADTINQWVSDNTDGMIPTIVQPPIAPEVIALLINALYLEAEWAYPFDTARTRDGEFHRAAGDSVECRMMRRDTDHDADAFGDAYHERPIKYYHDDLVQVVELPYGDEGFRMTILLPASSISADSLIALLDESTWAEWRQFTPIGQLMLTLPKFKFAFEANLKDILTAMGMPAAFSAQLADFTELFVDSGAFIDNVKHKAFVEVDEVGTRAAAVTSITFVGTVLPADVICNRPFVFVIHELDSGAILFMGKVADPTSES